MVDRVTTKPVQRSIKIVYQLSQSAQKDVWRETDEKSNQDHNVQASCTRLQVRWLSNHKVIPPGWDEAEELVWIDPAGTPIVFIGGREAFRWDEKNRRWTYVEGKVPGRWAMVPSFIMIGHTHYCVEQIKELPLRVDRYDISMENLIELESIRRYDIRQSKIQADKKDAERRENNTD